MAPLAIFLPFVTPSPPLPSIDWANIFFTIYAHVMMLLGILALVVGGTVAANDARKNRWQTMSQESFHPFTLIALAGWTGWFIGILQVPGLFRNALQILAAANPELHLALVIVFPMVLLLGVFPLFEWIIRTDARSKYPQIRFRRFLWVK